MFAAKRASVNKIDGEMLRISSRNTRLHLSGMPQMHYAFYTSTTESLGLIIR